MSKPTRRNEEVQSRVCEVVVEKMGNACGQRKGIAEDIMLELEVRPIDGVSRVRLEVSPSRSWEVTTAHAHRSCTLVCS